MYNIFYGLANYSICILNRKKQIEFCIFIRIYVSYLVMNTLYTVSRNFISLYNSIDATAQQTILLVDCIER